jgi:hypothetical protein
VVKGSKDVRSGEAESGRALYALAVQSAQRKKYGGVLGVLDYQRLRHFGDRKGRTPCGSLARWVKILRFYSYDLGNQAGEVLPRRTG